jgi:hypothetical protein
MWGGRDVYVGLVGDVREGEDDDYEREDEGLEIRCGG